MTKVHVYILPSFCIYNRTKSNYGSYQWVQEFHTNMECWVYIELWPSTKNYQIVRYCPFCWNSDYWSSFKLIKGSLRYLLFYPQGFNYAEREYLFILGHYSNCKLVICIFVIKPKWILYAFGSITTQRIYHSAMRWCCCHSNVILILMFA